jgi:ribonuclease Z
MLQLAGIAIDAVSVGGLETCIILPGMGVVLDMGVCPPQAVARQTVLFTHAHIDHMGAVVQHCATRSLTGLAPPIYAVPAENIDAFHALFDAWRRLDGSALDCTILPAGPGTAIPLPGRRVARAARSLHRVPTLNWSIWSSNKRLRADLMGQPPAAIQAARARGEEVNDHFEVCDLAFTGDTLIEAIERVPDLRKARVLICEVTFLDDRVSVAQARDKGHIHLDEIIERADIFENQAILMTHQSARYSAEQATDILRRRLPDGLRERVHLLAPRRMRPVLR